MAGDFAFKMDDSEGTILRAYTAAPATAGAPTIDGSTTSDSLGASLAGGIRSM